MANFTCKVRAGSDLKPAVTRQIQMSSKQYVVRVSLIIRLIIN